MTNFIGESIKALRRARDLTQDQLAERLNVSAQAISKWERGENLPDVTMIAPIADYFGVTTDTVLGVDRVRDEERLAAYAEEIQRSALIGDDAESLRAAREMYAAFPNNWDAIGSYISALENENMHAGGPYGFVTHGDELIRLCTRVRDECTVAGWRFSAAYTLIAVYTARGETEKAEKVISEFPSRNLYTEPELRLRMLKDDEWHAQFRQTIWNAFDTLIPKLRIYPSRVSDRTARAAMYKKCLAFLELFFEDGDCGFMFQELAIVNVRLAGCSAESGDGDAAARYAVRGLDYARQFDAISGVYTYTSMFIEGVTTDFENGIYGTWLTCVREQLDELAQYAETCAEIASVIEQYEPFADGTGH
ncbi:MAG: helix-turn-helix domain-containing protein [Oscillospiraceae bacterium]|jgi:transcriptional regulator with XRE-family HTH domain|nr:helix-turn-helix domain-containing protein [Oscillospiraceae bacterium]